MPIESFNYLDSLNPSYPASTDGLAGGDDHIRGIKASLLSTFPNLTGEVEGSHSELNTAVTYAKDGCPLLADAGVKFKTNTKDGFENPVAGKVVATAQDGSGSKQTVIEITGSDKKLKVNGPLQALGAITGPGSVPIGASAMWFTNTLPSDSGWTWANGQKVNVSDNPVLAALWTDRLTDGGTKIQLPDMREVVPIGNSTMGATTARGLITHIVSGLSTIAGVIGNATHALTNGQMPKHRHGAETGDGGDVASIVNNGTPVYGGTFSQVVAGAPSSQYFAPYSGGSVSPIISVKGGLHKHPIAYDGNDEAHNNVQPSSVVNWIIRIG